MNNHSNPLYTTAPSTAKTSSFATTGTVTHAATDTLTNSNSTVTKNISLTTPSSSESTISQTNFMINDTNTTDTIPIPTKKRSFQDTLVAQASTTGTNESLVHTEHPSPAKTIRISTGLPDPTFTSSTSHDKSLLESPSTTFHAHNLLLLSNAAVPLSISSESGSSSNSTLSNDESLPNLSGRSTTEIESLTTTTVLNSPHALTNDTSTYPTHESSSVSSSTSSSFLTIFDLPPSLYPEPPNPPNSVNIGTFYRRIWKEKVHSWIYTGNGRWKYEGTIILSTNEYERLWNTERIYEVRKRNDEILQRQKQHQLQLQHQQQGIPKTNNTFQGYSAPSLMNKNPNKSRDNVSTVDSTTVSSSLLNGPSNNLSRTNSTVSTSTNNGIATSSSVGSGTANKYNPNSTTSSTISNNNGGTGSSVPPVLSLDQFAKTLDPDMSKFLYIPTEIVLTVLRQIKQSHNGLLENILQIIDNNTLFTELLRLARSSNDGYVIQAHNQSIKALYTINNTNEKNTIDHSLPLNEALTRTTAASSTSTYTNIVPSSVSVSRSNSFNLGTIPAMDGSSSNTMHPNFGTDSLQPSLSSIEYLQGLTNKTLQTLSLLQNLPQMFQTNTILSPTIPFPMHHNSYTYPNNSNNGTVGTLSLSSGITEHTTNSLLNNGSSTTGNYSLWSTSVPNFHSLPGSYGISMDDGKLSLESLNSYRSMMMNSVEQKNSNNDTITTGKLPMNTTDTATHPTIQANTNSNHEHSLHSTPLPNDTIAV